MDLCGVLLGWGGGDMVWGAIWTSKVWYLYECFVYMFLFLCSRIHVFLFFIYKAQVFRLSLLTFCNLICILCIESPVYDFTWVLVLLLHMLLMF